MIQYASAPLVLSLPIKFDNEKTPLALSHKDLYIVSLCGFHINPTTVLSALNPQNNPIASGEMSIDS